VNTNSPPEQWKNPLLFISYSLRSKTGSKKLLTKKLQIRSQRGEAATTGDTSAYGRVGVSARLGIGGVLLEEKSNCTGGLKDREGSAEISS
jgi:hypothetical protein